MNTIPFWPLGGQVDLSKKREIDRVVIFVWKLILKFHIFEHIGGFMFWFWKIVKISELWKIWLSNIDWFHFKLTKIRIMKDDTFPYQKRRVIYIEEMIVDPKWQSKKGRRKSSDGFHRAITIHDVPLRGLPTVLSIKKKKWYRRVKGRRKYFSTELRFVKKGMRITNDLYDLIYFSHFRKWMALEDLAKYFDLNAETLHDYMYSPDQKPGK